MQGDSSAVEIIGNFLPFYLVTATFAFGAFYLAPKIGANRWLWLPVCLIPLFNIFAICAFLFRAWGGMLDRLNEIDARTRNLPPSS